MTVELRLIYFLCRPTHNPGDHVAPAMLFGYCLAKNIPRPCCFCPLKDATKPVFVEAIFLRATEGVHAEEYVAKCPDEFCGYFGACFDIP